MISKRFVWNLVILYILFFSPLGFMAFAHIMNSIPCFLIGFGSMFLSAWTIANVFVDDVEAYLEDKEVGRTEIMSI